MASDGFSIKLISYVIASLAIVFSIEINSCIEAKGIRMKDAELIGTNGTVKTIKNRGGDIIDCVLIYKQPAFSHPILSNHSIQDIKVKPNSYSTRTENNFSSKLSHMWYKNEQCPEGTIPIKIYENAVDYKKSSRSINHRAISSGEHNRDYAAGSSGIGYYYGSHAILNVWNPQPEPCEFSLSQIWVASDMGGHNYEAVEAGWHVFPGLYGDSNTRFFIYWTSDDYQSTGCYNLQCPGFVQTNVFIVIGGILGPTSTYAGSQYHITLDIYKDGNSGNWMLAMNNDVVGYWPSSIFNNLAVAATRLDYGGEIIDCNSEHHTTTPMGSGHFSDEGYRKASYINEIRFLDPTGIWGILPTLYAIETRPGCYDVDIISPETFYFGGPGFSSWCP